jgi:hypothetical protein
MFVAGIVIVWNRSVGWWTLSYCEKPSVENTSYMCHGRFSNRGRCHVPCNVQPSNAAIQMSEEDSCPCHAPPVIKHSTGIIIAQMGLLKCDSVCDPLLSKGALAFTDRTKVDSRQQIQGAIALAAHIHGPLCVLTTRQFGPQPIVQHSKEQKWRLGDDKSYRDCHCKE